MSGSLTSQPSVTTNQTSSPGAGATAGSVWGVSPAPASRSRVPCVASTASSAVEPVPDALRLPCHVGHPPVPPELWVIGVHGGAGESTLSRSLAGSLATGHAWPRSPSPAPALLVARSTMSGLNALRLALRDWASGATGINLAGAVIVAAAPGGVSRRLNDVIAAIAGTTQVWRVPWCPAWIESETPSPESADKRTLKSLSDLASTLNLSLTIPERNHQ